MSDAMTLALVAGGAYLLLQGSSGSGGRVDGAAQGDTTPAPTSTEQPSQELTDRQRVGVIGAGVQTAVAGVFQVIEGVI